MCHPWQERCNGVIEENRSPLVAIGLSIHRSMRIPSSKQLCSFLFTCTCILVRHFVARNLDPHWLSASFKRQVAYVSPGLGV
jgi:hypothetical protein